MDKFSLYVPNFLPCKEYFEPKKNNACPGCGISLAVRQTYKAVEDLIEKAVWEKPASGKASGSLLKIKNGKNEITICFDNEAGGNLDKAVKKTMPAVAVAEGYKYVATASPSYPFDFYDKIKSALDADGDAYIHVLCPCPEEWGFDCENTVKVGFWAVESNAFPLYEVGTGFYNQTIKILNQRSLGEYLSAQKRFKKTTDKQFKKAEDTVKKEYSKLLENIQPE